MSRNLFASCRIFATFILLSCTVFSLSLTAQQPPQRDPQAIVVLTQCLTAAGGVQAFSAMQDFTASGTITYFWADQRVSGTATVRGRGSDQFRLDANLPQGVRSHAVSHGSGALRDVTGRISQIPYHNTINAGILTFPYPTIAAGLNNTSTSVTYIGLVQLAGRQTHQVRVQRHLPPAQDPQGTISKLTVANYFVDTQTGLVVQISEMTHPIETFTRDYPRDIELQNYRIINGVNVPTLIREKISGNTTWELELTTISFNTGLTDAHFTLN